MKKLNTQINPIYPADKRLQRRKLLAEIEALEIRNDAARNQANKKVSFFDQISRLGGAATSLVAITGLFTSTIAIYNSYVALRNYEKGVIADLIIGLNSEKSSQRHFSLEALFDRSIENSELQKTIIQAISEQKDLSDKIYFVDKISSQKFDTSNISDLKNHIRYGTLRKVNILEVYARGMLSSNGDSAESNQKLYNETLEDLHSDADTLISYAEIERRTSCSLGSCGLDLTGAILKRYDFVRHPFDLKLLRLDDASLWGVDFYGENLSGATFLGARVAVSSFQRANLQGVNFERASFGKPMTSQHLDDVEMRRNRRTIFSGADLSKANFRSACLQATDFRGAKGLLWEQFEHSFNKGALFPPQIETALVNRNLLDTDGSGKCA